MPTRYPLSVLIVEANYDTADRLSLLLELLGHRVRVARSGRRALALLDSFTPEVVILEIGMPGMDGYTTARKLCKALIRRPLLVALTADPDREVWSRIEGFDHHFVKPLAPISLFGVLARYECRLSASE